MIESGKTRATGLSLRVLYSLLALAGIGLLMFFAVPSGDTTGPETVPSSNLDLGGESRRCEDELARILDGMKPGRMGITTDRVELINQLNSWHASCGLKSGAEHPGDDGQLARQLLTGDTLARTESTRFLPEDASHFRTALLIRDIAAHVTEGRTTNLDRYVALFDFISRNVMLISDELRNSIPLTPYESLVFGMGADDDRAWIFAEMLRQMRIDGVLISPRQGERASYWLVGVIDPREGILLFDPRLGLPIPSARDDGKSPFPQYPATLKEVRESDAPFRRLDMPDLPYPLQQGDLTQVRVQLLGTSSHWAGRMALLQYLLPQGLVVELYDGLGNSSMRSPGEWERVVAAGKEGGWTADDVTIWSYPEQQLAQIEAAHGIEGTPLANYSAVFKGPFVPRQDASGNIQLVPIDRSLHFVRVQQLRGEYNLAIQNYLPIRTAAKLADTPANKSAAEFAALWTGVAQFETNKPVPALQTFERFAGMQSSSIGLTRSAMEWGTLCLLANKKYLAAAALLAQAPPGFSPQRDYFLIRRWQRLGGVNPDEQPAPATRKKPESDTKPQEPQTDKKSEPKPGPKSSESSATGSTVEKSAGDSSPAATKSDNKTPQPE